MLSFPPFTRKFFYLGDSVCRIGHIGGLVSLPRFGSGRERAVRFNQQSVQGKLFDDLPEGIGLLVCYRAGDGDVKAHIETSQGHIIITRKAVDHTSLSFRPVWIISTIS